MNSKRSACDRCRSQKLRCPPREPGTNSCTRCSRLQAWCVTSIPRPPGRVPKNDSQAVAQIQPELRPKEINSSSSNNNNTTTQIQRPTDANQAAFPSSTTNTNGTTTLVPQQTSTTAVKTTPTYHSQSFIRDDNLDIFGGGHSSGIFPDSSLFLDNLNHEEESGGSQYHDLDELLFPLPQPSHSHSGTNTCGSNGMVGIGVPSMQQSQQQNDAFMNMNEPPLKLPRILECDPRLSSLVLDMSRRIQQGIAIWGPQDSPMLHISRWDGGNSSLAPENDMTKLFGDALGDLSEFLVIIQSYTTGAGDSGSHSKSEPSCGSGRSEIVNNGAPKEAGLRIGIVVILNLISAYLQVVAIYDQLFRSLYKQLSDSSSSDSPVPKLRFAGFSVQPGNLQTKIVIHAILHQFEMIERILGMPPELCVTDKRESSPGLLDGKTAESLLDAISNKTGCNVALDDPYYLKTLSSLRDIIKRIQMI